MRKKTGISEEERALFRDSVKGVRPLSRKKTLLPTERPKVKTRHPTQSLAKSPFPRHKNHPTEPPVTADEFLSFAKSGLQIRVLRKLRRGEMKIEAQLDLHGLTLEQAHHALDLFLEQSIKLQRRCVIIIHGKGRGGKTTHPVLKNQVNNWLRQYANVLAFCTAKPADGGTGAVYVLLKF